MAVVPEMSEAIIVKTQDLELVLVLELTVQAVADHAVEHPVGLIVALDEIRHEKNTHLGKYGRGGSTRVADRNVAGFDGIDDLELLGQERPGVKFDFELALCPLVDRLGHLGERHGGRFGRRHDMGHNQLFWR